MGKVEEIEKWLNEFGVSNYVISEDFSVIVHGSVNLNGKLDGKKLPFRFKMVDGYFDISNNFLKTLEGCPEIVTKDFNCSKNNLDSLFDAPKEVGDFDCSDNNLKDLSYAPKVVRGFFDCSNNKITSIKGTPRSIKGYFKCSHNNITSLKNGPKHIDSYFDCSYNKLEKLIGGPFSVGQDYICHNNNLVDLDGLADEIGWDLLTDIRLNHVDSTFNEQTNIWRYKGSDVISHIYKPLLSLTNPDEIRRWLVKHEIKNFNILKDNSVDVIGDVRLSNKLVNMIKLPLKFNEVQGSFDISDNELTSLEGSPKKVTGDFIAHKNELSTLKGSPKEVGGNFIVLQNNISSLKFAPNVVNEDFICSHNPLRDLDGLNIVKGSIFTGVFVPNVKAQKFVYKGIITYKYPGELVTKYLDNEYVTLTDSEIAFEQTKKNIEKVITKMLDNNELTKEKITDTLLNNLKKYHLDNLKEKVLAIKYPKNEKRENYLSETEIINSIFDKEL